MTSTPTLGAQPHLRTGAQAGIIVGCRLSGACLACVSVSKRLYGRDEKPPFWINSVPLVIVARARLRGADDSGLVGIQCCQRISSSFSHVVPIAHRNPTLCIYCCLPRILILAPARVSSKHNIRQHICGRCWFLHTGKPRDVEEAVPTDEPARSEWRKHRTQTGPRVARCIYPRRLCFEQPRRLFRTLVVCLECIMPRKYFAGTRLWR